MRYNITKHDITQRSETNKMRYVMFCFLKNKLNDRGSMYEFKKDYDNRSD